MIIPSRPSTRWTRPAPLGARWSRVPYPTDDLEWWKVTTTGRNWGIQASGYGTVFHESGNQKATLTVVKQVPGPLDWVEWVADREFRGNQRFSVDRLCAYFGYEVDD